MAGQGNPPSAGPSGIATRVAPPRPTRLPGGQVVTAANLRADSAIVRIETLICTSTLDGFALADDLGSGSLGERPEGCRAATAGEVMVRAETLSPDGFPVTIETATSDQSGTVLLTVPIGQGSTAVRLTSIAPVSDATTTMTLLPGQIRSLTLIVPDPATAALRTIAGSDVADEGTLTAAGGPAFDSTSMTSRTGWFAVAGLLLAALAAAVSVLHRPRRHPAHR